MEDKNKKVYILKPPLKVKCMDCENELIVLFCPPKQAYSHKNDWGWWTKKAEDERKYKCNICLSDLYNNRKYEYLGAITDSKKRRLLRSYFYDKRIEVNN